MICDVADRWRERAGHAEDIGRAGKAGAVVRLIAADACGALDTKALRSFDGGLAPSWPSENRRVELYLGRARAVFLDVMAVSGGEVLVDEIDYPNGYIQEIQRLERLDLTRLDPMEHARK